MSKRLIEQYVIVLALSGETESGELPIELPCVFIYDVGNPIAVHLDICTYDESVRWSFARDLLAAGVEKPVGEGDVRVYPQGSYVAIELSSPDGKLRLSVLRGYVRRFLDRTYTAVPRDKEAVDTDQLVRRLLARHHIHYNFICVYRACPVSGLRHTVRLYVELFRACPSAPS